MSKNLLLTRESVTAKKVAATTASAAVVFIPVGAEVVDDLGAPVVLERVMMTDLAILLLTAAEPGPPLQ
jgi:hypothetical protein